MTARMNRKERDRFDHKIMTDEKEGWTFEVWEEKNHKCCVVCVVRKEGFIAREYRFPTSMLLGMMGNWYKGIFWLEKELKEEIRV